jgi:hypothetical protein
MSDPATTGVRGSIEVKWGEGPDAESRGLVVAKVTVDAVQMLLEQVHGFDNVQQVEPIAGEEQAEAVWTAMDDRQRMVRVILWREPDIDETLIGQIINMVTQVQQEELEAASGNTDENTEG